MNAARSHSTESVLRNYRSHSLENFCPPLANYLRNGLSVIDVGCGPGTVTVNIAKMIGDGKVTGIDLEENSIAEAGALAASVGVDNAEFVVGDAYSIPFANDTFDFAFSSACFEYLQDPISAARELVRVTKPGGTVVVRAGDFGSMILYPQCPTQMELIGLHLKDSTDSADRYFNAYFGRELFHVLSQSDLLEIEMVPFVPPLSCNYPGTEYFEWRRHMTGNWLDPDAWRKRRLFEDGEVTEETLNRARRELDNWLNHPGSFFMVASMMGIGRVE